MGCITAGTASQLRRARRICGTRTLAHSINVIERIGFLRNYSGLPLRSAGTGSIRDLFQFWNSVKSNRKHAPAARERRPFVIRREKNEGISRIDVIPNWNVREKSNCIAKKKSIRNFYNELCSSRG
jgi:hypothetical protein